MCFGCTERVRKMITCQIETINAKRAKEYLAHNMVNRNLNARRVNEYIDVLSRGDWQLNGETVKFNENGDLIDGQHRLSAVAMSGIPMETIVIRGICDDVSICDRGRVRSVADSLQIEGMDKRLASNAVIAAVKLNFYLQTSQIVVSDAAVRQFIKDHDEELLFVYKSCFSRGNKSPSRQSAVGLGAYYAMRSGVPGDVIDRFMRIIATGFYDSKEETAPVVLRNDLIGGGFAIYRGSITKSKATTFATEKAIYDFSRGTQRTQSYSRITSPTFSNNPIFKEEIK